MPPTTALKSKAETSDFEALFKELTSIWLAHQQLKAAKPTIADLANSNARLFRARMAMGGWYGQVRR